ncbi:MULTISPECIES: DUF1569 domain-containing protein [Alkalimonas]|uniref:DUF1569 domain-containing protein n=1 Tax=Alkalimonas mucilaginosa TaxID=3057676 RepID=A0ABU7JLW6_9GAMM|nr:DUF1569 domain-containing protein [Alkalimonas sp. MEB004]MEE2025958.1 DUF1569 domain-containing protein [Alkalimonas sp. MEB004]
MKRRAFLGLVVATPVVLWTGTQVGALLRRPSLQELTSQLRQLPSEHLASLGDWSVSQIFQHCAQSVRYSRLGYPEQRSRLFQLTVGSTALAAFSAVGKMQHPLNEPLPGAPELHQAVPVDVAQAELIMELEQFIHWQGALAPHFAYGRLSKAQYYNAHWLHLQDHLSEIVLM